MKHEKRTYQVQGVSHEVKVEFADDMQDHIKANAKEAEGDWKRGHDIGVRSRGLAPILKAAQAEAARKAKVYTDVGRLIAEKTGISEEEAGKLTPEEIIALLAGK